MRTVTGAIGRVNRNAYRVTTPTATVGIRGTGGVIQVLNDGSTLVIGTSGIWSLTNPAGSIDVPAGVSGLAPTEPNTPPRESNTQPQTSTAPVQPQEQPYTQGNNVTPEGTADLGTVIKPLVSGPGYHLVAAFSSGWTEGTTVISQPNTTAVFNETGQLTSATGGSWAPTLVNGTHADFGTDGILAWGRWVGEVNIVASQTTPDTHNDNQGYHYVIGMPTPVMPTTGTATYSLAGATRPTYTDGSFAPGTLLPSSNLSVTFGATHTIGASLQIAMQDGKGFSMVGTTTSVSSAFSMTPTVTGTSGGACSSSCSGSIQGFFAGATAERVGLGYRIQEIPSFKQLVGTAAFKKN